MASVSFDLNGKVACITGGGSGIGRACAIALAEYGADVAVFDSNGKAAEAVAGEVKALDRRALSLPADVASEEQVDDAIARVIDGFGSIDILVNSAGLALRQPAVEHDLEAWNKVFAVNVTGSFLCARPAARRMIARGRGGAVINMASIMGFSGGGIYPNVSYQSSKGAVVNMTRALAIEWAPHRIRVNAVAPCWVKTPFIGPLLENPDIIRKVEQMTPLGRMAEPEEIAGAVVYLASPAASMVTGHILAVDGGFLAQ